MIIEALFKAAKKSGNNPNIQLMNGCDKMWYDTLTNGMLHDNKNE